MTSIGIPSPWLTAYFSTETETGTNTNRVIGIENPNKWILKWKSKWNPGLYSGE